jgi:hypothetical protein
MAPPTDPGKIHSLEAVAGGIFAEGVEPGGGARCHGDGFFVQFRVLDVLQAVFHRDNNPSHAFVPDQQIGAIADDETGQAVFLYPSNK